MFKLRTARYMAPERFNSNSDGRRAFKLRTSRHMAPERFDSVYCVRRGSKESDIYSLAMASFTVCFPSCWETE